MDDYVNPYRVFIDVLSYRYASPRQIALTGEMIAMYASRPRPRSIFATWSGDDARFQDAVDGLRGAVEAMRHEFELLGMASWIY